MKTNIEKVKELAKLFADFEVIETDFPFIVKHPFTDSNTMITLNGNLIDITKPENKEQFKEICFKRMERATKFIDFSTIITKPYRSIFFKYSNQYASDADAAQFLKQLWIGTETVNVDVNISKTEYVKYFKKYKKEDLMTKEELDVYNSFDEKIVIYRGINQMTNHPVDGLSWTPCIEIAEFFANRFSDHGEIYQATIHKKDILAYFDYEKETVVDFRKLKNIKRYK